MKTLTTLIAVATLTASGITIASADPFLELRSETVRFADLDTSSVYGAQALYHRIQSAAKSVCRDLEPDRQLGLEPAYQNCVHQAIGAAVMKINRPAVTAYAAGQGVRPSDAAIKIARTQ